MDWLARLELARDEARKLDKTTLTQGETDRTHAEIQAWLRDLGLALGYRVWIAANDRGRLHEGIPLGHSCLEHLPTTITTSPASDSIRLIDVLWLDKNDDAVAAAFEVEHSTSIYSGIVRMLDLALSGGGLHVTAGLFLVAPDAREAEVRAQLRRPAFSRIADLKFSYLPYSELERNRDAIARFGSGLKAICAIASKLPKMLPESFTVTNMLSKEFQPEPSGTQFSFMLQRRMTKPSARNRQIPSISRMISC